MLLPVTQKMGGKMERCYIKRQVCFQLKETIFIIVLGCGYRMKQKRIRKVTKNVGPSLGAGEEKLIRWISFGFCVFNHTPISFIKS